MFAEYPWNIFFSPEYKNLRIFLFLPNYNHPSPYASKLIREYLYSYFDFKLLFLK